MITKTLGVYITEKKTLPSSIADVATAVPLFIGYTERTQSNPIRINNLLEFENHFGKAYEPNFTVKVNASTNKMNAIPDKRFFLYDTLSLYFKNGGGSCYIKSALTDTYSSVTPSTDFKDFFLNAISLIDTLDEVTLVLIPDLHYQFKDSNGALASLEETTIYKTVVNQLINTCGSDKDKFAILDFHQPNSLADDIRNLITPDSSNLKYASVYYPWLKNAKESVVKFDRIYGYSPVLGTDDSFAVYEEINKINSDLTLLNAEFTEGISLQAITKEIQTRNDAFNTATSPAQRKTKLTNILNYFFAINKRINIVEDASGGLSRSDVFITESAILKNNPTFIEQIQRLYKFIKILKVSPVSLTSSSNYVNATWTYPTDISWFNFDGDTLSSTDIENAQNYLTAIILTKQNGGQKTRAELLADFNAGIYVDTNILISAITNLIAALNHEKKILEKRLFSSFPDYMNIKNAIQNYMKTIPSQGAIAGIYCKNDRERGVWKSPANITIQGIEKPLKGISDSTQERLNVDSTGKSINAIRTFAGKGTLVWGARTLGGRDNEWRYISVRRFFSFAEKSIKKSMTNFVFEPNNSKTWVKISAMISSFLADQWKAGALMGATIDEAFFVRIGKDITTSTKEISEGKINVQIGMAVVRPAEFIIINVEQHFNNQ
ncbi:phage tail sheath family protein [Aquimarina longa]|uniref:phage tail sheath family protein n=1 Tax=Aquimarina longa TaxID=1080221 RepID=UPI0007813ACF|nr:phage tail sheath C-terminal domain-containing protein [Aquimarina longa]